MTTVRVGTRGSALALRQTETVVARLAALHPQHRFVTTRISTRGDVLRDVPLAAIGGSGVFVDAIEEALRAEAIDLAVHSAKDLPSRLDDAFRLGAVLERGDPRDVMVSRFGPIAKLPVGARVGTSSVRRACQIRDWRPDLELAELRGNVDSRLRKLDRGAYDAIVLAAAGLARLGLEPRVTEYFDAVRVLPSPGQGTLVVEIRAGDDQSARLVAPLMHQPTAMTLAAERAFLARLGAGCAAPVGAYARFEDGTLRLDAFIGAMDGRMVRGTLAGAGDDAADLGVALANHLLAHGGDALLQLATPRRGGPDA